MCNMTNQTQFTAKHVIGRNADDTTAYGDVFAAADRDTIFDGAVTMATTGARTMDIFADDTRIARVHVDGGIDFFGTRR